MNAWVKKSILNTNGAVNVIASAVTDQQISHEFNITARGALNFLVGIKATSVTQVGTITVKLQTQLIDGVWEDSKTTTFTSSTSKYIRLNVQDSDDWDFLPLLAKGRIVITTSSASDRITISELHILQGS